MLLNKILFLLLLLYRWSGSVVAQVVFVVVTVHLQVVFIVVVTEQGVVKIAVGVQKDVVFRCVLASL